jgi:pentatricopeptide repeat protein
LYVLFLVIKCLSRSGNVHQARLLFERMLRYANQLGLYAEELGPSGAPRKFPTGVYTCGTHHAAFDLNRRLSAANENSALRRDWGIWAWSFVEKVRLAHAIHWRAILARPCKHGRQVEEAARGGLD